MADQFGFLKYNREKNLYRPIESRILDFAELQIPLNSVERQKQAARCMNCGIPFCHAGNFYNNSKAVSGCPNENLIPEWNDLLFKGDIKSAFERLARTNPLPEMTGRVCPAPCEQACTEGLHGNPITIHDNERFIIDTAFAENWILNNGKPDAIKHIKIAIIGSGPAGLSAAWRLNQLGYSVEIFERSDRFGGLLMYGIPNMKLDKQIVQRRIDVMKQLGIKFHANVEVGNDIAIELLYKNFDRIIVATGASVARDLNISGRDANGIYFALDYLTNVTNCILECKPATINAYNKHVCILGGGDTGNDCIATALRQGAATITQLEITSQLPNTKRPSNNWPQHAFVSHKGYGQEEANYKYSQDITHYNISTTDILKDSNSNISSIKTIKVDNNFQPIPGTELEFKTDMLLLAMGFTGAQQSLFDQFGIKQIYDNYTTNNRKVLIAGDAKRGASLVIWAIMEGRKAAEQIDHEFTNHLFGCKKEHNPLNLS